MEVLQTPNPFPVPEPVPLTYGQRLRAVWEHCQRGLVYTAPYAIFTTFWTHHSLTRERLSNLMNKVRHHIHEESDLRQRHTTAILGVSFRMWSEISQKEGLPLPKGMTLKNPQAKNPHSTEAFPYSHGKFMDSEADLWFHIKSHDEDACQKVLDFIVQELKSETKTHVAQPAASTSNERGDNQGKVLGCRFSENLNNPADPISLAKHTLVGGEDMAHFGGSFVLSQRFMINWSQIHSMSEEQIEDLIGRKTDDTIIPGRDSRSHIILSRIQDEHGNTTPILRLGLPFGKAKKTQASDKAPKGITSADENGIYYAGFSKNAAVLEKVMMNQIGSVPEFMNDRLMNHIRSDLGGIYYIPSADDLKLQMKNDFSHVEKGDWSRFPGVDWNRIIRHYRIASENGLMYYNHQHFLFAMATGIDRKNHYFKAPSPRILSLLEMTFRLWQDNWYFNRKQEEIPYDLSHYVNEYQGADRPSDVMQESIMVRKGWAIRMSLNLFTSKTYGFRGRRILINGELKPYSAYDEERGKVICGSGTYHISPEEIIVGAMPNLTLGEGRYVMRYLTEQERQDGFINNLSEASGVGHVIPNFEKALEKGLKGLMEEVKAYESKAQDPTKRDVYTSSYLALKGISEYCLNYASLAKEMAHEMSEDQHWERHNLTEIAKRMIKLSTDKPDTFVEALQLIFVIHCALHLNGEPTALGRLDQLLDPFYKKGHITEYEAQEAIEAFYIKLDEKVQQNRLYMEDHQPFGNLAMGGSAGVYPQAASLGQWIQQLTVGGTVANGETPSKPAYNDVTRMFIRASGKLPLNAPCLSLRTRKDIPEDLLKEAAHAILSGGAHPILLNDEMLIPGLHTSGDGVGGDLSEDVKKRWNSKVSLKSAQNYACDGCYEPQFPGENWFSLGGFSTLQPLECAINQGKSYAAAGQAYLNGKRVSVRTKPADEIKNFDELMDLYYEHFDWLNRKAFTGQVMGFGANTTFCPSPILNVFMDDCLAKGQDFYAGGARYNVYGPCYISLSTTINSLYAIKMMVFDEKNAVTTLEELRECLCCDWGYFMSEPFISKLAGEGRIAARSDRFKRLRQFALSLPKYGRGHPEIDTFGNKVVERIATLSIEAFTKPWPQFKTNMELKANAYGTPEHKFGFQIQPGVGTFENHVEMGAWNGASADGRRNGTTVASDLSASPSPADLPIDHQFADFPGSLKGFESKGTAMYSDGAPTDYNIQENYPPEKLAEVLKQFAQGASSNVLTVTVANPDTFTRAVGSPEQFDLLRVRTGGWSTFFTSVFPVIQEQHRRRPVSVPEAKDVVTETKKSGCPFHYK